MNGVREEKLYIQTFHNIRALIIENDMREGDPLPTEQAMCQRFGVSRNVLREAVKSMELMGMIESCAGRGTVVKDFNMSFIFQNALFFTVREGDEAMREMLGIRKTLELGYMRRAYNALEADDVDKLRSIVEGIKEKWRQQQYFHADDMAFHMALFAPLKNTVLNAIMDAIWGADENFCKDEKLKYLNETVAKHERIVRALEMRDVAEFERAMRAHFESGKYLGVDTFQEY